VDKSFKKAVIRERNRKSQIARKHAVQHKEAHEEAIEQQHEIIEEQREASRAAEAATEEVTWSAKTQDIRNRLNGKKRQSAERWNRFAGTSAAGGRGL
jgi:hypothetical protein